MSCCKLRTPWPIHFKLCIIIGIDSLMVCILFGEISIFHSRVMGLYSSNCRQFFVCRMNWNIYTYDTFFEKSVKTINSNNSTKFVVNWRRGSQFTARHKKNRQQFKGQKTPHIYCNHIYMI
jgi:hypothetical protein